jgi:protease-4
MEGQLGFANKQIEHAAKDKQVKAVELRINSPGGSITASDELHRKLTELKKGDPAKKWTPKELVVSMGSLAASGGYYVAMPAETILAERSTMTGSIGVYAAFLNVAKLAEDHGVTMNTIKAGAIKDSGSPFRNMTDKEKQVWQDMVNEAYKDFLQVVEEGRPKLKGKLLDRFEVKPVNPDPKRPSEFEKGPYERYLADGGIWTAAEAKERGLIDAIGNLDDAVAEARKLAKLPEDAKVIQYEKQKGLAELLLGSKVTPGTLGLDLSQLKQAAMPRLWFLAPGSEFAALLSSIEAR